MKDGELICAFEEERLNRVKHWAGLPFLSIKECLKHARIKIGDINNITINSNPYSNFKDKLLYTVNSKNFFFHINSFLKRQSKKLSIKDEMEKFFKKKIKAKILRYDHHLSHIASSYYLSGFKDATGISIDGFGDFCSMAISKCKGKKIDIVARTYYPNSLGVFYEGITQILGFNNYGDEYKVMGLSAYGKPKYQKKTQS
jgi:carbamoyltransferase